MANSEIRNPHLRRLIKAAPIILYFFALFVVVCVGSVITGNLAPARDAWGTLRNAAATAFGSSAAAAGTFSLLGGATGVAHHAIVKREQSNDELTSINQSSANQEDIQVALNKTPLLTGRFWLNQLFFVPAAGTSIFGLTGLTDSMVAYGIRAAGYNSATAESVASLSAVTINSLALVACMKVTQRFGTFPPNLFLVNLCAAMIGQLAKTSALFIRDPNLLVNATVNAACFALGTVPGILLNETRVGSLVAGFFGEPKPARITTVEEGQKAEPHSGSYQQLTN